MRDKPFKVTVQPCPCVNCPRTLRTGAKTPSWSSSMNKAWPWDTPDFGLAP